MGEISRIPAFPVRRIEDFDVGFGCEQCLAPRNYDRMVVDDQNAHLFEPPLRFTARAQHGSNARATQSRGVPIDGAGAEFDVADFQERCAAWGAARRRRKLNAASARTSVSRYHCVFSSERLHAWSRVE